MSERAVSRFNDEQIIFRQLNEPVPDNWIAGLHWQVEYHNPAEDYAHILGLAWVTVGPTIKIIDMVLVLDQCRGQGVGKKLIKAIIQRWPDVWLTEAISDEGEALLKSLEREGVINGEHLQANQAGQGNGQAA